MFKISPIQDFEAQKECLSACGGAARDGHFAYSMREDTGKLLGASQFELTKDAGYITDLRCADGVDDFEAMFILGRATMNFIDMCGLHKCRAAKDSGDINLLRAIGFRETEDGDLFVDMTGFFDGNCSGHSHKSE